MAYFFDSRDRALVINGFQNGIADDPYSGISDMRNVNIISVPGEASVAFSTSKISSPNYSGTMTTSSAVNDTVTLTANPEPGQAIQFSVLSDTTKGIALNTTYWVGYVSGGVYKLYSDYPMASLVNITADSLTGTWATVNMGIPKYFAYASREASPSYWMVDSLGQVWSNARTTANSPFYWTYTGNKTNDNSHGNGIVYYSASDGTGYVFVFSNSSIDYTPTATASIAWQYQWSPSAGTVGAYSATPTSVLKTSSSATNSHESIVGTDNRVYYCDSNWVGVWYQTDSTVPFVPTTKATYTFDQFSILPTNDISQCLTQLGTNLLVGGQKNVIYPWDRFSPSNSYPILISESNIQKMVTVNTNTYIFVGNRGRIWVTNGSQAQLYKKIPDHLSGTVEPYFIWGGVTTQKNQLYFSAYCTTNSNTAITQYGGLWAIDLNTSAIRLTNKLSYDTYGGYATAITPNFTVSSSPGTNNPSGTGLYIGWNDGSSGYGIDQTSSSPYTGSQSIIVSELIPIGTFNMPRDFERIEYRLSKPLVSGESINIYARLIYNTSDTGFGSAILTDSTVGNFSGSSPVNFKNAQWLQLKAVLNSTASSPSYVRLTEFRITGLQGQGPLQQITI